MFTFIYGWVVLTWIVSRSLCFVYLICTSSRCSCSTHMDHVRYACDIYHGFVGVVFLYREVFEITVSNVSDVSIVVAVELSADTLVDTLSYLVSKISVCIRYDG